MIAIEVASLVFNYPYAIPNVEQLNHNCIKYFYLIPFVKGRERNKLRNTLINKIHGGSYSLREEKKQLGQKELVYEEK